jgi:hypothetical protein
LLQFGNVAREVGFALDPVAAQGAHRVAVGARRAAEPEVDAAGVELGQCAEGFGDHQRRVVGQHDAARADADAVACRRRCSRPAPRLPSWRCRAWLWCSASQ